VALTYPEHLTFKATAEERRRIRELAAAEERSEGQIIRRGLAKGGVTTAAEHKQPKEVS
jgi:hypothetical protein